MCESFEDDWYCSLINLTPNPSLRTYVNFKFSFKEEPYLHVIKEQQILDCIVLITHQLAHIRNRAWWYDRPQNPSMLGCARHVLYLKMNNICECSINWEIREHMYSKVNGIYLNFAHLSDEEKFVFLITNTDHRIINWLGKFVYQSSQIRDGLSGIACTYGISQEICTQFCCALLGCGYAIVHNEFTWSIYPYSSGLLCWHWGNR